MNPEPPQLLRVSEVAERLAVHENTVWKFLKEGSLGYIKAGKSVRVTTDELWRYVERDTN